jgi:hypothetical protein
MLRRISCLATAVLLSLSAACTAFAAGLFGDSNSSISANDFAKKRDQTATKSRATTDISDLWWNPNESGWGMQLVQNNNVVFATLFIYGADGKPTWYTALLGSSGNFTWSGPLIATMGPWFGSFFNPNAVTGRQVGSLTFQATDIANGVVTYSVDGTPITKAVTRETLTAENIGGTYRVVAAQDQVCVAPLGTGHFISQTTFTFSHIGNSVAGQVGGCIFNGTYGQTGKIGIAQGTYSCSPNGEVGSFLMSEIIVTETGMMFRLTETSNLCSSIVGQGAGLRQ